MDLKTPEEVLGKRIVNYLRNEALIGRITKQRLQNLGTTLGVYSQVKEGLASLDNDDSGPNRGVVMSEILSSWTNLPVVKHHHHPDGHSLASALDSARLGYHAQEVRSMSQAMTSGLGTEVSKPLVIHTPNPSRSASPQKLPALNESVSKKKDDDNDSHKNSNSNSDSGVFTSESSKENDEKEDKKPSKRGRRILKRKPISYRVKKRNDDEENLASTDSSIDLKENKVPELPPVNNKHLLQINERPEFVSPRTPQKLPSIHSRKLSNNSRKKQIDRKLKDKKAEDSKSPKKELINNEETIKKLTDNKNKTEQQKLQPPKRFKPRLHQTRRSHSVEVPLKSPRKNKKDKDVRSEKAPDTADTIVVEVSRSKSDTVMSAVDRRKPKKRGSSHDELLTRSASIRSLHSSRPILSSKLGNNKKIEETVDEGQEDASSKNDKHLTLLNLDETFTKDDFGNKTFSATAAQRDLARTVSKLSIKSSRSRQTNKEGSEEHQDLVDATIEEVLEKSDFVNVESHPDIIKKRIDVGDKYIKSMCYTNAWFCSNYVKSMAMFGTSLKINTRTQAMVWIVLCRLAFYWSKNLKHPPTEEELLTLQGTIRFLLKICKLCFNLIKTDQIQLTAVQESKTDEDGTETILRFEQFDIALSRLRLENFEICVFHEQNTFNDPLGHFVECRFEDRNMVEFLAATCIHIFDEDIPEIGTEDISDLIPLLCGVSSVAKDKEQNLVINFAEKISSVNHIPIRKESEFYLHKRQLQNILMNDPSPMLLFHSVYEARMKNIHDKHPNSETELNFLETKLENHDLLAIAYYLEHLDRKHIKITSFVAKNCSLHDDSLKLFSNKLIKLKTINLNRNQFTGTGMGYVIQKIGEHKNDNNIQMEVLDLSECNLNDDALETLSPIVDVVKELSLNDNQFTSQGIKKFADSLKKSQKRKLTKLDFSRCDIGKQGFYELIPVLLRTQNVTFQGQSLSPLELKEFSTRLAEFEDRDIKSLDISSCGLTNESMPQIVSFVTQIENVDLHNSDFGVESMKMLVKQIQEHGAGKLRTLNLRMCKLNDDCLEILSDILPKLFSVTLSSNNFSGINAVKSLCHKIENSDKILLKYLDMKYSRLSQDMKKSLGEVCKKHNIDLKVW